MNKLRRLQNILGGLLITGVIGSALHAFGGAEARMKKLCLEITPGTSLSELKAISVQHGVTTPSPKTESGVNFLVEEKSFGRWGCKVVLENGVVKSSEYNFSD